MTGYQVKEVMDSVGAMLNDAALRNFTYVKQLPYLNIAIDEMNEVMEVNNVAFTNAVDAEIQVPAGITGIGGGGSEPVLPVGLVEIRGMYERPSGSTYSYIPMNKREFLPQNETQTSSLIYWAWIDQRIEFIGSTADNEVKIQYIKNRLERAENEGYIIPVINTKTLLTYRTAGLCARYIGENPTRADELDGNASGALDRFLTLNTKGKQSMPVRRRPFMAGWKNRGIR